MNNNFFLELVNVQGDTMSLEFEINDTPIGHKWYSELIRVLAEKPEVYDGKPSYIRENDRLYSFPNDSWTEEKIVARLASCITAINSYKQTIDTTVQAGTTQDQLNLLHRYYSQMRGRVEAVTDFYTNAPGNVQDAIDDFNVTIHRYEHFIRGKNNPAQLPYIVVTFNGEARLPLADEDFDECKIALEFGGVYLNYTEVGKHLLEVFHDDDDLQELSDVVPQKFYSA